MSYNKIIIIGDAGRGKTTLAEALSKKLGIKHYSTDDFYFEKKYTIARNREDALLEIRKVYSNDKWIVEGTTYWLLEDGFKASDLIIYLKYNSVISQWFTILRRHIQRGDESIKETLKLMRHVLYKRNGLGYKKGKPKHSEVIAPYRDKVVVLSSFKAIEKFLLDSDNLLKNDL